MSDREQLEAIRRSALDAICTLHAKMLERALSIQQIAEVGAWATVHKTVCDELGHLDQNIDVQAARYYLIQAIANYHTTFRNSEGMEEDPARILTQLRDALSSLGG